MRRGTLFGILTMALLATVVAGGEADTVRVTDEQLNIALQRAGENRAQLQKAIDEVSGERRDAMRFLIAYMPESDLQSLSWQYLVGNVEQAYRAREATAWGKNIPDAIFFNDVLPYAAINERRDDWRADFVDKFLPLVQDCTTPAEAAQILNREAFKMLDVRYHASKRPKPDQSPYESIEAKFASCTGLSVLLIDACRAVCVPTRFVGTPSWTTKRGNHSWVEIWSEGDWHFTGACEYNPDGLNRGWFQADAAKADPHDPRHAIYASSWKTTGTAFPLVWARHNQSVAAVNVTDRYANPGGQASSAPDGKVRVSIDVWSQSDNERVARKIVVRLSPDQAVAEGTTNDAGDDTNHRLELLLAPEAQYRIDIQTASGEIESRTLRTTTAAIQHVKLTIP